jgi:hypothetical protein
MYITILQQLCCVPRAFVLQHSMAHTGGLPVSGSSHVSTVAVSMIDLKMVDELLAAQKEETQKMKTELQRMELELARLKEGQALIQELS